MKKSIYVSLLIPAIIMISTPNIAAAKDKVKIKNCTGCTIIIKGKAKVKPAVEIIPVSKSVSR